MNGKAIFLASVLTLSVFALTPTATAEADAAIEVAADGSSSCPGYLGIAKCTVNHTYCTAYYAIHGTTCPSGIVRFAALELALA